MDHVEKIIAQWERERPDLDVSPQAVFGRLHRLALRLHRELVSVYEEHGLNEGEFDVLATLRRSGTPFALTPTELARSTMVTTGAITKRIDRCVNKGLVRRSESPDDGRGRLVSLTAEGKRVIDDAFTEHIANEHRLVADLPASDRRKLAEILVRWNGALGSD